MTASNNTMRRGGIATMAAGALFVISSLIKLDDQESLPVRPGDAPPSPSVYLIFALDGIAVLLLLGGLAGLGVLHAGRYDRAGRVGLRLARFGAIVLAAYSVFAIVVGLAFLDVTSPMLTRSLMLVGLVAGTGGLALLAGEWYLGLATLRARVLTLPWRALPMATFALDVLPYFGFVLVITGIVDLGGFLGGEIFPTLTSALWGLAWLLVGYALWSGRVEEGEGEEQVPYNL